MLNEKQKDMKQLKLDDALNLIYSEELKQFDVYCRMLTYDYHKYNLHFSEWLEYYPEKDLPDFINEVDNYGSFWLQQFNEKGELIELYQILDNKTGNPL